MVETQDFKSTPVLKHRADATALDHKDAGTCEVQSIGPSRSDTSIPSRGMARILTGWVQETGTQYMRRIDQTWSLDLQMVQLARVH